MSKKNGTAEKPDESLQPDTKVEPFTRQLLVPLTDKEKRELSDRTAHLLGEIEQMTEDQKASAKQAKAQLDERKAELRRVSTEYRDGQKYAPVRCERRLLFRLGVVQEVRVDTGEVMHERPMNDRERQLELSGVDGADQADNDSGEDGLEERLFAEDDDDEPESAPLPTQKRSRRKKAEATAP